MAIKQPTNTLFVDAEFDPSNVNFENANLCGARIRYIDLSKYL